MIATRRVSPEVAPLSRNLQRVLSNRVSTFAQAQVKYYSPSADSPMPTIFTGLEVPSVRIFDEFADGHFLGKFILQRAPISTVDFEEILNSINLDLIYYPSGTMPAALNPDSSYSQHAWTRDMAIKAYALYMSGDTSGAVKIVENLARFYNRSEERNKFASVIFDPNPKTRYNSPNANELPNIRGWIDEHGEMQESPYPWDHRQLDAMGMWLWLTFRMANERALNLEKLDNELVEYHRKLKKENANYPSYDLDSTLSVALKFLRAVEYWDQIDAGWAEDFPGRKRSSSIGVCLAAFKEAQKYFRNTNWNSIIIFDPAYFQKMVESAITPGQNTLNGRLPVEIDESRSDAGQVFLLYPFNPGLTRQQEEVILDDMYENRMGEIGFTRRHVDYFQGQNYPYNRDPRAQSIFSAPSEDHRSAQWTLFDPLLAAYYYKRYVDSNGEDEKSCKIADKHTKRALAMITKQQEIYRKSVNGQVVIIDKGQVPELYWFDTYENRWRPGENAPLLMAEAAYALMFKEGINAAIYREAKEK